MMMGIGNRGSRDVSQAVRGVFAGEAGIKKSPLRGLRQGAVSRKRLVLTSRGGESEAVP